MASAATTGHCDNCFNRHVTSDAVRWCPDCEEALCETCLQHHNASKLLKSHETVALVDNNKLPDYITELRTYCSEHDEKFEVYCMRHQECCCLSCFKEKHHECTVYETIKNVVKGVKTSPAFEDVEHSLEDVIKNFNAIIENRTANKARISEQNNDKLREIKEFRENVNRHLDKMEQTFLQKLSEEVDGISSNLDEVVQTVSKRKANGEEFKKEFENIKVFATEIQAFLGIKVLEGRLDDDLKFQNTVLKELAASEIDLKVEFSDFVQSFKDVIVTFGNIQTVYSPPTIELVSPKKEQAQIMMPVSKSVNSIQLSKITMSVLKGNNLGIYGCTLLPRGLMAFCDIANKAIIVCKRDGSHLNTVFTEYGPFDITFYEYNVVAVTLKEGCEVGLFDLWTGSKVDSFKTSSRCYGIDFQIDHFFIRLEGQFVETDLQGNVLKCIKCTECVSYVCLADDSFFSTDKSNDHVFCYDKDGCQKWKINIPILNGPRFITRDSDGFLYVTGEKSKNVVVISPDGQNYKEILSTSEIPCPFGIYFDIKSNTLLISEDNTGNAFVYAVSFG